MEVIDDGGLLLIVRVTRVCARLSAVIVCGMVWAGGFALVAAAAGTETTGADTARGRGEPRIMPFDYRATDGCPGAETFASLVAARTAGTWRLVEKPGAPDLSVEVVNSVAGKTGRLRRAGTANVRSTPREISAADCADVIRALALTAALALEEERVRSATPAASSPAPPPALLSLGGGADAALIVHPHPMVGAELFLERGRAPGAVRGHAYFPDLRLSFRHLRNDFPRQNGKAGFNLTTAAVTGCPLGWWAVQLCAHLEAGALGGRGREIEVAETDWSFWMATGGWGRLRTRLGGALFLEMSAGALVPLRRASFIFRPSTPVANVPSVIAVGGFSLGIMIP